MIDNPGRYIPFLFVSLKITAGEFGNNEAGMKTIKLGLSLLMLALRGQALQGASPSSAHGAGYAIRRDGRGLLATKTGWKDGTHENEQDSARLGAIHLVQSDDGRREYVLSPGSISMATIW